MSEFFKHSSRRDVFEVEKGKIQLETASIGQDVVIK